jgi:hypothetical protein
MTDGFRKLVPLLALAIAIALNGCATRNNNTMQSWVGRHQSELILAWGPPDRTTSDGNGGSILIYGHYVDLGQTSGQVYGNGSYTAPQQQGYQRTRMFYVNSAGVIYSWRWQGL